MKNLFLVFPLLLLLISGCATTQTAPTTGILTTDQVTIAQKPLIALGALLQATPGTVQTLMDAGKITKDDYNKIVPVYNKVLAGWNVAVSTLKTGASAESYTAALNNFLVNKAELDVLLTQFGIGGVK